VADDWSVLGITYRVDFYALATPERRVKALATATHRQHMSVKLRYSLLALGCIVHAAFLGEAVRKENTLHTDSVVWRILDAGSILSAWLIGLSLLCLWPAWCFLLWKYGIKKKMAVAIPMLVGLVVMWPLFFELFGAILLLTGAAKM
jgi:hypothetical protein